MGNLVKTMTRIEAKSNSLDRKLIMPVGFRIFLLKRAGETSKLVSIREITVGAVVTYSDWRQQLVFKIATLDATFPDDVAQTSYWGAGVGRGTGNKTFDVYGVDPQRRDVVQPTADNANWRFFLTRDPRERFVLP